MKKIILIGFATSGKSSVGRLLAAKLNTELVDTDQELERELGMTIQQIFDEQGEAYFRAKETQLLLSLSPRRDLVVACGGGCVLSDRFEDFAKDSVVVWLTATTETVQNRLGNTARPLFDLLSREQLEHYVNSRAPLYQRYAQVVIATDDLSVEQIADSIMQYVK